MSRARYITLAAISVALCAIVAGGSLAYAGGGAWNKPVGGYYVKFGITSLSADEEYDFLGGRQPLFRDTATFRNGSFGVTDIGFYGELGLTEWLTGTVTTQYKVAVREAVYIPAGQDSLQSSSGLGDIWLGARLRLMPEDGPFAAALTLGWKIPTGSPNQEIPLGTGVVDYEAALGVGTAYPVTETIYGYLQGSGGYRLRNGASDELNYQLETGVQITPELMLQAVFDGTYSTADFDKISANPTDIILASQLVGDQSYTRLSGGVIYALAEDTDVNANYQGYISGINSLVGTIFSFGIAWKN